MTDLTKAEGPIPNAVRVSITKPIALAQLESELSTATGKTVQVIAVGPDRYDQPVAEDNPLTLWVAPASLGAAVVEQAVTAHEIQPDFGVPVAVQKFRDVLAKVVADPGTKLTAADRDAALTGLLLAFNEGTTVPVIEVTFPTS